MIISERFFKRGLLLAVLALAAFAGRADAQAQNGWTQAGLLTCKLNPSIGFIIAGHQSMECSYKPNGPYPPQAYVGAINTVGLDIGISGGGILGWAVFAPTQGYPPAPWPENMSAPPATSASASVWVPTFCSAAPVELSLCSRFRLRAPSPSISRSAYQC